VRSIRANLVLWVVGTLGLGTVVVLGATYVLTRNQVGRLFDEELKQVAHAVHLREDWTQTRRLRIARPGFALSVRAYDSTGRIYFETALPTNKTANPLITARARTTSALLICALSTVCAPVDLGLHRPYWTPCEC